MDSLLGIDLGTSGVKAVLFSAENGRQLAQAFISYPLNHTQAGWAEQDPESWWQATIQAIRSCILKATDTHEVKGIGLSGQMHGIVLLDAHDQVIRPSIIWADQRSEQQARWMTEQVGAERLLNLVSNPALTGFSAPKLLWVREHEPEHFQRTKTVFLPKDYLRFRLTGEKAIEISDAAGTCLLDVRTGTWSREVMQALGLDMAILPPILNSWEPGGLLRPEVAAMTGLAEHIIVAGGGADNACGALGNGIVKPGEGLISLGTSGVVLACMDNPGVDRSGATPRVHTFNHAVAHVWYMMGVTQAAGLSLRWVRDNLGLPESQTAQWSGDDVYAYLIQEALQVEAGSEGLIFLPYLQGERTPHLDAQASGGWFGLTVRHDRRHLIRAVLEGVAFSLRDCFEIVKQHTPTLERLAITGGGARSSFWRQLIADILGIELVTTHSNEGPALGAAMLAGVACGIYRNLEEACMRTIQVEELIVPQSRVHMSYESLYTIYQDFYPATMNLMHHLHDLRK